MSKPLSILVHLDLNDDDPSTPNEIAIEIDRVLTRNCFCVADTEPLDAHDLDRLS